MVTSYDESVLDTAGIVQAVEKAGYGAIPKASAQNKSRTTTPAAKPEVSTAQAEYKQMKQRLLLSALFTIPLFYISMGHMMGWPLPSSLLGMENAISFAFTQFLLLIPVVFINFKYYRMGFKTLFHGSPNMDSLIAIGSSAAIVYGIYAIYKIGIGFGHGDMATVHSFMMDLYFESAGMILTLITLGKTLEARAKGKTSDAITKLMNLAPKTATVERDGKELQVPVEEVQLGETLIVKAGESVPVDGIVIGFIGNPNCGKTTLFNAYTGANLKVANWPGVTVEKVEGAIKDHDLNIRLVDLPGTYSLTSYTMEEQVSRQFILSDEVDVIIDVADASALERNLYLTLQLLELGKPVVLALNMMDIVEKRGMEIDTHRLPEMLGIPVIPVSARKRTGLDVLLHAAAHHKDCKDPECLIHHHKYTPKHRHDHHSEYAMVYSDAIEDKIDLIMAELKRKYPNLSNYRWHAIKLLEQDKEISARYPVNMPDVIDRNYESDIINEKYDFIEEIIREVLVNKDRQDALTEKADRVLTHKFWSIPIFLVVMAAVFFLTFTIGDWLKGFLELGIESLSALISDGLIAVGVNEVLRSLLVDGIIAGVGGILTFLPNIFILFLALAFLEDSGYMARVAYVMEGIMSKLGLSGRAFIPMILGFGCTVPAIMASRSLENRRDRFKVMLITPFMSCSARLPIYILFAEMFFQERAMLVAYSMYLIGLVVAILVAAIIHLIDRRKSENYLLIELPEYKAPSARTVAIYVWEKVKDYLTKAGTTIFVASILMWVILNFGPHGYTTEMADSFGSILGHWLVPIFAPIGLGFWQIAVALIAGISAKEVVVSSCAVLFGIPNINSGAGMDTLVGILGAAGFGQLNAFCLMIFCLLYVPCAAALATIRKESGSTRWMLFSALFQLVVAWAVTFVVYRVGLLL